MSGNGIAPTTQIAGQRGIGHFNKPGWAWEYLRRNREYVSVSQKAHKTFEIISESSTRKIVIAHSKCNPLEP